MRAARLYGAGDIRIEEVPVPRPGPGEVLLRVRAVSICPSDWRLYVDGHAGGVVPKQPIVQGHEFSGDVVAVGEGVDSPAVGARVAVEPSWHCGACDMCREGAHNLCRKVVFPSFPPHDGGLAEYIACPAFAVETLPEQVGYVAGAMVEPLGVAYHAVRLAGIEAGQRVAVLGAGMIGLCATRLACLAGSQPPAVVDPVRGRHEWAIRMGATQAFPSYQELRESGFEAHIVLECSGDAAGLEQATLLARPGGTVVVVGIPRVESVTFDMSIARRRELTVTFARRSRDTLAQAVELVASGQVDLDILPFRRFSLEETAAAMDATGAQPGDMIRAVVEP